MANAGTVTVELSLDDKVYKQKLSENLTSTEATAKGIETSWKTLGTKSDAIYEAQRRSYENSLTLIKNSSTATHSDIVRAQEAAAAKIKSINEQQFGHHETLIGKMKTNWVAATVAVGAAMALVAQGMQYIEVGAKALQIESSFKIMSEAAEVNGSAMIASMKEATRHTIDDSDLMQKSVKLMLAGYDPEQIVTFSKLAVTASQYAGIGVGEAFERMNDAIANKTPKALVQLGAVTRDQMKVVQEAVKYGADSMSLYELSVANLQVKQLQLQGTQDEATIAVQRHKAEVSELTENIGKGLIVVMGYALKAFQATAATGMALTGALAYLGAEILKVSAAGLSLVPGMGAYAETLKKTAEAGVEWGKTMMAAASDLSDKVRNEGEYQAKFEKKASKESIDAAKAVAAAKLAALKKVAEDGRKATQSVADLYAALTQQNKAFYDSAITEADAWLANQRASYANEYESITEYYDKKNGASRKWYDAQWDIIQKTIEDEQKKNILLTTLNETFGKQLETNRLKEMADLKALHEKQIAATVSMLSIISAYSDASHDAQTSQWLTQANEYAALGKSEEEIMAWLGAKELTFLEGRASQYASFYGSILGYGDATYKHEIEVIAKKAEIYRAAGKDAVAVDAWVAQQNNAAYIKMAEASDDWTMGVKAGFLNVQREQNTWGKTMSKTAFATYESMSKGFSDIFYDGLTGNLKSLDTYFKSMSQSILRTFTDMIAKLAAQKIMAYFETSFTSAGVSALGIIDKLLGYTGIVSGLQNMYIQNLAENTPGSWAEGGLIPGQARYSGDHYGNDTVMARLSPGEYVVPRSAVNEETKAILDYIRAFGQAPGYAVGGIVRAIESGDPNTPDWSHFYTFSNGQTSLQMQGLGLFASDLVGWQQSAQNSQELPLQEVFNWYLAISKYMGSGGKLEQQRSGVSGEDWANKQYNWASSRIGEYFAQNGFSMDAWAHNNPIMNNSSLMRQLLENSEWYFRSPIQAPADLANKAGWISDDERKHAVNTIQKIAELVGSAVAMSSIMSAMSGSEAVDFTTLEGWGGAGLDAGELAAQMAAQGVGTVGGMTTSQLIRSIVINSIRGMMQDYTLRQNEDAGISGNGAFNLVFKGLEGADILNTMGDLNGIVGKRTAFSARNGLDYVPRDNFLANLHEGERVQTKAEADRTRNGSDKEVLYQIAKSVARTAKILGRFDMDGLPKERVLV